MFSFRLGSRYSGESSVSGRVLGTQECSVSGWVLGAQESVQFQAGF